MRWSAFAILVLMGPASAGAYDDFSRGLDANNRGNNQAAQTYFTRAIEAGDLAASYLPSAHLGRARALLHDRHCREARRDLSDALRLKPDFVDALSLRAEAEICLDLEDAALADASAAIRLKPAAGYYFMRSRLYWNQARFAEAYRDAHNAMEHDPANSYFVLWSAVTGLRVGKTDAVPDNKQDSDWPSPMLALFRGRLSQDEVLRAASGDRERVCEADFYVGQWRLAHDQHDAARSLFQKAERECPRDFVAFDAARRELKRLGPNS